MSTRRPEIVCLFCCKISVGDNETLSRYQIGFPAKVNLMRRLLEQPVTRGGRNGDARGGEPASEPDRLLCQSKSSA